MLRSVVIAALLTLAQPAFAQGDSESVTSLEQPAAMPEPWLAGGLSLATPVLFGAASVRGFGLGAPLGFGVGHWHAGDPTRGALVTLGGFGAALAGYYWGLSSGGGKYSGGGNLTTAVLTAWGFSAAYGLWASYDAYQTAERASQKRMEMR